MEFQSISSPSISLTTWPWAACLSPHLAKFSQMQRSRRASFLPFTTQRKQGFGDPCMGSMPQLESSSAHAMLYKACPTMLCNHLVHDGHFRYSSIINHGGEHILCSLLFYICPPAERVPSADTSGGGGSVNIVTVTGILWLCLLYQCT